MKRFISISVAVLWLGPLVRTGFGQSATITTYAGLPFPVSGAPAITQPINPESAVPDGSGGLYVGSNLNRIYNVASDGALTVFAGTGTDGFRARAWVAIIPEPSTGLLVIAGLLGLASWRTCADGRIV